MIPTRRQRLGLAVGVALAWIAIHALLGSLGAPFGDISPILLGVKAMLTGGDPYALVGPGREIEWGWRFYYPATALWVTAPLAYLRAGWGSVGFVALSMALLAYGATARGLRGAGILLSAPTVLSGIAAQWTPLLTAAYLIPQLSWIWWAKPNFALPFLLAGRWRALLPPLLIGGAVLFILSFLWLPGWPATWWELVHDAPEFRTPLSTPIVGPLVLIALLRWRRPESRLLLGLSLVPQTPRIYNLVPLLLVARTAREMTALVAWSWIAWIAPLLMHLAGLFPYSPVRLHHTAFVLFLYLPVLAIILRRPNVASDMLGVAVVDPMPDGNDSLRSESLSGTGRN
jgi:hypothetical protein